MAIYLLNHTRSLVPFREEPALVLSYPALPGSKVLTHQSESGFLQVKEFLSDLFAIRYKWFRFVDQQAVEMVSGKSGLHSQVMIENGVDCSVEEIGPLQQRTDSASLFWSKSVRCHAVFEAGLEYKALDIYAAPDLVQQLTFFFPDLAEDLERHSAQMLLPNPCFVTPSLRRVINDILDCPYDEETSRFYFDLKVREYMYVLFEECIRSRKSKYRFTTYDAEQIHKAREVLVSNLERAPLTIRELSRRVALNEFKLKAGFKHFFNTTVFDCFQQARMERARHLLLTTNLPMKDICSLTGYTRSTSFITAFRHFFGYTPASLRRGN